MNLRLTTFLFFQLIYIICSSLAAQTMEEAKAFYSLGITAVNEEKYTDAINYFNESLRICWLLDKQNNAAIAELKKNSQEALPRLNLKAGNINYQNQQFNDALDYASKAQELSILYNDKETEKQARQLISLIHFKIAGEAFKLNNIETALLECDKATTADPDFTSAYYFKAVILRKQNDANAFIPAVKICMDACNRTNDSITKQKISDLGLNFLRSKGNESKASMKYDEAVKYFDAALEIVPGDAITLYLLATVLYNQNNFTGAISTAEKAIINEKGGDEAKAKIYMLIAESNAKSGNMLAACDAYKKAAVGQFYENANYQRQYVLKCE